VAFARIWFCLCTLCCKKNAAAKAAQTLM